MAFPLSDWTLPTFNTGKDLSQDFGELDYAKLADYLQKHPAGSFGALPPDAFSLDANTILIPPGLNADDNVSSPESSSATSSSNDRQDSAPLEVPQRNSTPANAQNNKRKVSGDTAPVATSALKDSRRGSARTKETVHHTHEEQEGPAGKGNKKGGTSEKRKEQNRNAQRAFRERREKHTKELEDQVAELQAAAAERDAENQNLKDMVTRLRSENEKLTSSSFTFSVPSSLNGSTSVAQPTSVSAPALNSMPSLFDGLSAAQPSFGSFAGVPTSNPTLPFALANPASSNPASYPDSPDELFAPAADASASFADFSDSLFTPSGEHFNPLASFGDILSTAPASSSAPMLESALSPGSAEALFSAYRDSSTAGQQTLGFGGFEPMSSSASPSTPSLIESRTPPVESAQPVTAECKVFRDSLDSLRGAEEYDLDSLCKDMMQKATCKQAAAVALEKAVSDDIDIHSFFSTILADSQVKAAYKK